MNAPVLQQILSDGITQLAMDSVTPRQWQVLRHVLDCRTPAMGSYRWHCHHCGEDTQWYCSCRDRHCPLCQGQAREQWLQQRQADTLPVPYHHLVFTLPHQFNHWASVHPDVLYRGLFMSVWQTLSAFANARHHLAGQLGMMAVLHTWGQQLERHIHLHCLVPAGVLTAEQTWCGTRKPQYLFPVRALSVKFRGKMRAYLAEQASMGLLDRLRATDIEQQLALTKAISWVVYSKPTLTYQETVVRYLARYCNRVGLSNNRLSWQGEHDVGLAYKNYRTDQASIMHCSSGELVRRFILHVLPKGFMRLRYYGFLANAVRRKALGVIRANLCVEDGVIREKKQPAGPACPHCHEAGMVLMSVSLPWRGMAQRNKERLTESSTS